MNHRRCRMAASSLSDARRRTVLPTWLTAFGDRPRREPPRPGRRGVAQPRGRREGRHDPARRVVAVRDRALDRRRRRPWQRARQPCASTIPSSSLRAPPPDAERSGRCCASAAPLARGRAAFHRLAACAVPPQLRFGATVYLGLKITALYGVDVPLVSARGCSPSSCSCPGSVPATCRPTGCARGCSTACPKRNSPGSRLRDRRHAERQARSCPGGARHRRRRPGCPSGGLRETERANDFAPRDAVMADHDDATRTHRKRRGTSPRASSDHALRAHLTVEILAMIGVLRLVPRRWWLWPRVGRRAVFTRALLLLLLYVHTTAVAAVVYFALRRFGHLRLLARSWQAFSIAESMR